MKSKTIKVYDYTLEELMNRWNEQGNDMLCDTLEVEALIKYIREDPNWREKQLADVFDEIGAMCWLKSAETLHAEGTFLDMCIENSGLMFWEPLDARSPHIGEFEVEFIVRVLPEPDPTPGAFRYPRLITEEQISQYC